MNDLLKLLLKLSLILNLMLFYIWAFTSFVPHFYDVKTVYDRKQEEAYKDGFIMTRFCQKPSPEGWVPSYYYPFNSSSKVWDMEKVCNSDDIFINQFCNQ